MNIPYRLEVVGILKTYNVYTMNEETASEVADLIRKDEYVSAVFVTENGQYREDL